MIMKTYRHLIADVLPQIQELLPWDIADRMNNNPLLLDVREPKEFNRMRIQGSINAPRGILEQCCEWNYEETIPELANARQREIVVICRSGNRSALAAHTMQLLGFEKVYSLKTGLRGWNDYELPLINSDNREVPIDDADDYFTVHLRDDQRQSS